MRIRRSFYRVLLCTPFLVLLAHAAPSRCAPSTSVSTRGPVHHPDFIVPAGLRARVDFWKEVFSKYGREQVLIHHRNFPQAVFAVLDFTQEAQELPPLALERRKKQAIEQQTRQIQAAFQNLANNPYPRSDLESRIAAQMAKVPGNGNKYRDVVAQDLIRSQTGIKEKYYEAVERSGRYLPLMEGTFREFGLPKEITRLPFVESSFNYMAYSSVGAAGIWQFMPRTARLYMTLNRFIDERRDPVSSTRAAAMYLASAYNEIGTWPLAITSYNHGVAGVLRKMKTYGTSNIVLLVERPGDDRPFGFASSNFFPEFLAAVEIYDDYRRYFPGIQPEPALHLSEHKLPQAVSARFAAHQLGVSLEDLRQVNYAISDLVWSGRAKIPANYTLKVPKELGSRVAALRVPEPHVQEVAPPSSAVRAGIYYKVRKGDTLSAIARRYNITVAHLKDLNGIDKRPIRIGQALVIRQDESGSAVQEREAAKVAEATHAESRPKRYKVAPGETLHELARRFGVSVSALQVANHLRSATVQVGEELKIPDAPTFTATRHEKAAGKASTKKRAAPSTRTYTVKAGENLWTISRRFNLSTASIKKANKLRGNAIKPGQKLRIPN